MSSSTESESDSSDGDINVAAEKRKLRKKRRKRNLVVLFGFYLHARKYLNKRKRKGIDAPVSSGPMILWALQNTAMKCIGLLGLILMLCMTGW